MDHENGCRRPEFGRRKVIRSAVRCQTMISFSTHGYCSQDRGHVASAGIRRASGENQLHPRPPALPRWPIPVLEWASAGYRHAALLVKIGDTSGPGPRSPTGIFR